MACGRLDGWKFLRIGAPHAFAQLGGLCGAYFLHSARRHSAPMRGIVAAAILVGLIGCGRDAGIGESASARLTPHVVALRAAAASGERAAADEQLAAIRRGVTELRQAGQLSEGEAAEVL